RGHMPPASPPYRFRRKVRPRPDSVSEGESTKNFLSLDGSTHVSLIMARSYESTAARRPTGAAGSDVESSLVGFCCHPTRRDFLRWAGLVAATPLVLSVLDERPA